MESYKDDMRVGHISGFNYGYENKYLPYDYLFSKYPNIWGWASWANRWKNYSLDLEDFDEIKSLNFFKLLFDRKELLKRLDIFNKVKDNKINSWDYQWSYALYKNMQFTIIPKKNYVLNLGFGVDATHTYGKNPYKHLTLNESNKSLCHPRYIVQDINLYKIINKEYGLFQKIVKKVFKK